MKDLYKALDGRVRPHHLVLLSRILAHIDFLDESLAQLEKEMEQHKDHTWSLSKPEMDYEPLKKQSSLKHPDIFCQ